jgi:hypothetical protein
VFLYLPLPVGKGRYKNFIAYSTSSLWRWSWQRVSKRRQTTICCQGNTQKHIRSYFLIIFRSAKPSTRIITHACWYNWRTLWRKNAAEISPSWSCSYTTTPRLTGHLIRKRNWTTWAFTVLIIHRIFRIWPVGLPPVFWTEKTIESSSFFVWNGGHCCRRDLVGRTNI